MFVRPHTWKEIAQAQDRPIMGSAGLNVLLKRLVLLIIFGCLLYQNIEGRSEATNNVGSTVSTSQRVHMLPVNPTHMSTRQNDITFHQDLLSFLDAISPSGWKASDTSVLLLSSKTDDRELLALTLSDPEQHSILAEFGCVSIVWRNYERDQRHLAVRAYEFKTPQGAYAAYSLLRSGASTIITRGDASSEDDQSISFCKANYFIKIYGTSQEDEENKGTASIIADSLDASLISRGQLPSVLSRLPVLDRVRGTEKIVMGPTSGRKFFPAPYLGSLALDKAKEAVTADYQFQQPYRERMKLLIVDYGKDQVAAVAYYDYVNSLRGSHEEQEDLASPAATNIFRISGNYLLCRLRGPQIVLIVGARKRLSSIILAKNVL